MLLGVSGAARRHLGGERCEDLLLGAGAKLGLHSLVVSAPRHPHLEKVLLAAHHAARPADSAVPDGLLGGHAELVDEIGADERAGAAQPGLAVHRHRAGVRLQDRDELQHLVDYASRSPRSQTLRQPAVGEVEVEEVHALRGEARTVVGGLVEAHHRPHAQLREEGEVVLRGEGAHVVDHFGDVVRTGEREETVDDDPIHVAVLHAPKEFVLGRVKEAPLEDVLGDRDRQPLETMLPSELKIT